LVKPVFLRLFHLPPYQFLPYSTVAREHPQVGWNAQPERFVKLKHWIRFLLYRDSTWHGQFTALAPLLLERTGIERTVVDVGANDGFYSSNSYPFIARGWRGLLIEPNPAVFRKAQRLHKGRQQVTLLNAACSDVEGTLELQTYAGDDADGSHSTLRPDAGGASVAARQSGATIQVKVHRLESLLKEYHIPQGFGLLTIDTEGHDLQVLRGANMEHYRPQVIITEINPDDEEKSAFLRENSYRLHATLAYDTVWTRS
jgi:FkbM family methyltransferase